jgi:potassium efflux system protein
MKYPLCPATRKPELMTNLMRFFFLCLILFAIAPVFGEEGSEFETIDARLDALNAIETRITRQQYEEQDLAEWQKQLSRAKVFASACLTEKETTLKEYKKTLSGLGEPDKDEPREVAEKRTKLSNEKAGLEKIQSRCQLLDLRSRELSESVDTIKNQLLTKRMLHRGDDILSLVVKDIVNIDAWWDKTHEFVTDHSGLELLTAIEWVFLAICLPAAWYAGLLLKKFLLRKFDHKFEKEGFANEFTLALLTTGSGYLPLLLLSLVAPVFFLIATGDVRPVPIVNIFAYGLPLVVTLLFVVRLIFAPFPPARPFISIEQEYGVKVRNRLHRILIVAFILYLMAGMLHAGSFPDYLFSLVFMVMSTIMVVQVVLLIRLIRRSAFLQDFGWVLLIVNILLIVSQVAHLAGYENLGILAKRTITGAVVLWGLAIVLHKLLSSLFDSLDQGASSWSIKLRSKVGVKEGKVFPGLFLVRLAVALLIWGGFIMLMLKVFGMSGTYVANVQAFVVRGFTIGTFQIVPAQFFWGLISFSAIVIIGNWIRSRMRKRWLNLMPISSSGRDTLLTLTGYTVYAIAILFALGMVGMDYTKLALIAGALSVGIGFGLQNIVSNFISGLILLFERPVRIGDWVAVGGIEGYVRKINIRATVIETFDRSEVIVPNSEFISGQVTNWTLNTQWGRLKAPVGVAYGSDTEKVKQILIDVARDNKEVILDGRQPEPYVIFLGFGDSSLDFELRCFIRDIDRRLRVLSEINFAIDKAFRESGIEIPFPQRDLHIRSDDTKPLPEPPEPPENPQEKG